MTAGAPATERPVPADQPRTTTTSPALGADALAALAAEGRALLAIDGMWCASCASALERVIARSPGMLDARVSFDGATALLRWDPARVDLGAVAARVADLGYRLARPLPAGELVARIGRAIRDAGARLALSLFLGVWTMSLSLVLYLDAGGVVGSGTGRFLAALATAFAAVAVLAGGWPMLKSGWRTLRAGVPGMDALIGLGAGSALVLSIARLAADSDRVYADTAVMLVVLAWIGRLLELTATRRAALAIAALQDEVVETAELRDSSGNWRAVPARRARTGDLIRVAAGARVPLDGVVTTGGSDVDRSLLTGEPGPVSIGAGDQLEAGCINLRAPLTLRVTAAVGARRIDRLGLRIAEALGEKGATQRLAERFAGLLVPIALALGLATLVIGLVSGLGPDETLLRAVSVLVVACPCAVALAVPLTSVTAAARAAGYGILFRTPRAIEGLAGVGAVLFDKTGTLTEGRPRVTGVVPAPGEHPETLLAWAARAERGIEHPIARALREAAGADADGLQGAATEPGWINERDGRLARLYRDPPDLAARVPAPREVLVGSAEALRGRGVRVPVDDPSGPRDAGSIRVEVARDGRWAGCIRLADGLRVDSVEAVHDLRAAGIEVAMITGDRRPTALAVAERLSIPSERVVAGVSPESKAERVAAMGCPVAFVGDGINDGVALARSAAGIAVTDAAGTATAAADIVLAGPGLGGVVTAHRIARRARRIMLQNLGLAVGYNAAGLVFAAAGAIPPGVAALAMVASSACVIANAGRIRWVSLGKR